MSNAYTNQILFGHSKEQVNAEYINGLLPYMFTDDKVNSIPLPIEKDHSPPSESAVITLPEKTDKANDFGRNSRYNSLFWSIYEMENPNEVFLNTRANVEIEERMKVVESLKKTPKRLRDTNSKLTLEQTQTLFGAMMVSKEEKLDFCIAYAVYYNKSIMVIYERTYCIYSPTVEIDLSEDTDVIIIYASSKQTPNGKKIFAYSSEKNPTKEIIEEILRTKVTRHLKAISNYKNPELDEIAYKLQIDITYKDEKGKEKRRKKEDIYNDIRVKIHNDMQQN